MVLGENLKRLDSQVLNLILRKVWLKVKNLQHEKTLWKHCNRISHTTNTLNVHLKFFSPNPSPGLVALIARPMFHILVNIRRTANSTTRLIYLSQLRQARVEGSVIMDALLTAGKIAH
jgi:hypothetical protein